MNTKPQKRHAGSPWKIEATANELRVSKRQQRKPTLRYTFRRSAGESKITWSSEFQSLPILGAIVPKDTSLILWRYKDNARAGQAVATDGDSFWLFQAIHSTRPITKRNREGKAIQIDQPMIIGHLQRSNIILKPDKTKLTEKLRNKAEFIPTPFSEMSPERLEGYRAPYRAGRANLLAVGGEPATGKSFILKQLIATAKDWQRSKAYKLLDYTYSKKLNLYVLGKYEDDLEPFPGTDRLSMAVQKDAEKFLKDVAASPVNVVFEGDRLFNRSLLECAMTLDINLIILCFKASKTIKSQRHVQRNDDQTASFKKRIETKIDNICHAPLLWECVEEVRHESKRDSIRILKMISWFLIQRKKLLATKVPEKLGL